MSIFKNSNTKWTYNKNYIWRNQNNNFMLTNISKNKQYINALYADEFVYLISL